MIIICTCSNFTIIRCTSASQYDAAYEQNIGDGHHILKVRKKINLNHYNDEYYINCVNLGARPCRLLYKILLLCI